MHNLIDFLRKHLYWLVFLLLEAFSLSSLFKYNNYQGSVYFTTANGVVGGINSAVSGVVSYVGLGKENTRLERENEELRWALLQALAREQIAAPDSLPFLRQQGDSAEQSYHFVSAKVVSNTLHKANNLMTINKGRADGIRPEMGVVTSHGVAGIVYLTSEHYAIVIPLLNTRSQVSCRMQGSNYFGTMQWQRGDPTISYVDGIPRHAQVNVGDEIETNGYSDIFPAGVPIGRVATVGDSPDGLSYQLTVKLYTDFTTLRDVSVITNYTKPERKQLEQHADSLMMPRPTENI